MIHNTFKIHCYPDKNSRHIYDKYEKEKEKKEGEILSVFSGFCGQAWYLAQASYYCS